MAKSSRILSEHFQAVGEVGIDERKRVSLAKALESLKGLLGDCEGLRFAVHFNQAGQVLLSPKVSVPAHELWLYRNTAASDDVVKGPTQVGKRSEPKDLGSFEKYVEVIHRISGSKPDRSGKKLVGSQASESSPKNSGVIREKSKTSESQDS